ncbi:hypothetical protein Y032_0485g2328 [Ancylostoma ceylanicum]|uniref:Uncharacterized protein n=1 Tax=Ancylostoma ceylanicum TaxID=53326 RepID=A0A016WV28_9BILA|nr:hypothetical protein Y032_0485g2328 [Ancylostoma ceylanicum]
MYYDSNTVQMAARSSLDTLVADKVHSFQPRQVKRKGQLYTVHRGCRNGVEVPLLHTISSKKTEQNSRNEFNASVYPTNLSVVLDFEKTSINVAKRIGSSSIMHKIGDLIGNCRLTNLFLGESGKKKKLDE